MAGSEEKLPQEQPEETEEPIEDKDKKKEETPPKHPPLFNRDKMYRNVPFTVKQMDYIIAGIVAAMVLVLIIGLILR